MHYVASSVKNACTPLIGI